VKFLKSKRHPIANADNERLAMKISSLLWNDDFYGIGIGSDTPKDEFDHEAREIAAALRESDDVEAFTYKLINIFNKAFDPTLRFDYDNTKVLAQKIYILDKN